MASLVSFTAVMALCLFCAIMGADAACCTSGQPTYKGKKVNFIGLPTCSDGPCSGPGFDYRGAGASESPNPQACCDTETATAFLYNAQATVKGAKWPPIPQFPTRGQQLAAAAMQSCSRYRCTIGGQEKKSGQHRHLLM